MHNLLSRVNNISAFLSSCMMCLMGAVALSSLLYTADPKGTLTIKSASIKENEIRYYHRKQEMGFVGFKIDADLTPLFHWNTKQLFVWLEAEYTGSDGVTNEVAVWDRIVRRKEDAYLKVNGRQQYPIKDMQKTFNGVPAFNFTLKYNLMPHVGLLTYGEAARADGIPYNSTSRHI
ncbi:signal peptidase [Cylindrobasidium torrendii FP15055 ss-10]|uniref:Signal peptidase subunit 3 n=1 Tax=Cylindrobasidium torrendii FP15055 ss-10 TaxID=1314674 RepID=A0A0D7BRV9_9AGAR|nr:signal peptidase [Cylindrobasidium torrendii FP15055 ss-10]